MYPCLYSLSLSLSLSLSFVKKGRGALVFIISLQWNQIFAKLQVVTKGMRENHQIEEEVHPQALLYRNLWLEAEATICALKYKTHALSMIFDGMDGCKSIKN